MTLGYFLRTFLGFEKFAVGNTKGKMGIDWWPVESEIIDEELKRLSLDTPQDRQFMELLVFTIDDDEHILFHPWILESDGSTLELTHVRYVRSQDKLFVIAQKDGNPLRFPFLNVDQLIEIARKRLMSTINVKSGTRFTKKDEASETRKRTANALAKIMFESGPASATKLAPQRWFFRLYGLNGTGFAQPKRIGAPVKSKNPGIMIEPQRSI